MTIDTNIAPPAGVPITEANRASVDAAAEAFERIMNPQRPRAADGKFSSPGSPPPSPPADGAREPASPPQAPEQPPEGQPNAAAEGDSVEERFEIELGDGEKVEVSAAELAEMVKASKASRSASPPPDVTEKLLREHDEILAEKAQLARERQHYAQQLANFIPAAQAQLQAEFPDIKSIVDLQKLASEDPARYVRWQAQQNAIAAARAEQQQLSARYQAEQEAATAKYLEQQRAALSKVAPDLVDPVKGPAERQALRSFLNTQGFTDDELANLVDHRTVLVARKAMLYDRMMAARPEAKKVSPVVRTIRPGAARSTSNAAASASQAKEAAMQNLKKDQSVDALAGAFRAMGIR